MPRTPSKTTKEPKAKAARAPRKKAVKHEEAPVVHHVHHAPKIEPVVKAEPEKHVPKHIGKYIFATGRRKSSTAAVKLFTGKGVNQVNAKPLEKYFHNNFQFQEILKPFQLTGQANNFHLISKISGGGIHSQVQALQHALAKALSFSNPDLRRVLKKNGMLRRDDRKKERKKPGLKRARRAPQWAKR